MKKMRTAAIISTAILAAAMTGCSDDKTSSSKTSDESFTVTIEDFDPSLNENECVYGPPPAEEIQEVTEDENLSSVSEDKDSTESLDRTYCFPTND